MRGDKFLISLLKTPAILSENNYIIVNVKGHSKVLRAPYRPNGSPNRKAQAILARLKRKGGYYTLEGKK